MRVRTAFGNEVVKRALSGIDSGGRFAIVMVCSESEWNSSSDEKRTPVGTPWPSDDVWLEELSDAR